MTCAIIVQARMTSTRLPGKILKPVLGKPLLLYQLERLQRCKRADRLVVATTTSASDDAVVSLCESVKMDVDVFRGSEADVLDRYLGAAQAVGADTVVRLTSDCPLLDPAVVDRVIAVYAEANPGYDYVSNTQERTFPRGMDTEVFSFTALQEAAREAAEQAHREHVTPFFYTQPERYRTGQVLSGQNLGHHRWTVDTPEDFELIRRILEALYPQYPEFTLSDVLALLERHPDWLDINAHIEQVKVSG